MVAPLKSNSSTSWKNHFKALLKFYGNGFEDLSFKSIDTGLSVWAIICLAYFPDKVSATSKQTGFPCFPFIKRPLRILRTVDFTLCACERTFLSMNLLKTANRSTMTSDRLNTLQCLNIHPSLLIAHGPHSLNFDLECFLNSFNLNFATSEEIFCMFNSVIIFDNSSSNVCVL